MRMPEKHYYGCSVSPGIGFGKAYLLSSPANVFCTSSISAPADEKVRFERARENFCRQTAEQAKQLQKNVCREDAQILLLQQALAADTVANTQIYSLLEQGFSAEAAVDRVWTELRNSVPDRYADFEDVRLGLLTVLAGVHTYDFLKVLPEETVLVAEDISPAMVSHLNPRNVAAVLCRYGGEISHSATLLRAMGIPCVMHLSKILEVPPGTAMICDAFAGQVIAAPKPGTGIRSYAQVCRQQLEMDMLTSFNPKETRTADGVPIQIFCSISSAGEVREGIKRGAEGVGLFRTEFLWKSGAPDEETQTLQYIKAADSLSAAQPLCIRTLDPSRDKTPMLCTMQRGIRYCLANREQFKVQLRAVLRAAGHSRIHLLLPMVTDVGELLQVRQLLENCRRELHRQGCNVPAHLPLGVMLETPAAVFIADKLAAAADFFSVGTGDLTQYTMACHRDVADENMYAALPVLRAIRHAAGEAKSAGIPCIFCGDAAGDPRMIPLLLSFGIPAFSVCPPMIPRLRCEISLWTMEEAEKLTSLAMEQDVCAAFRQISRIREEKVQRMFKLHKQRSKFAVDEKFVKTY